MAVPSIHPSSGSVARPIIKLVVAAATRINNVLSDKASNNMSKKVDIGDSGKVLSPYFSLKARTFVESTPICKSTPNPRAISLTPPNSSNRPLFSRAADSLLIESRIVWVITSPDIYW